MSVILESLPGYSVFCIQTFHARPLDADPQKEPMHEIRVGDRVSYVASSEDEHFKDHPARWQFIFETADGRKFRAVDSLFVTEECWEQLENYFRDRSTAKQLPSNGPSCSTMPAA
jgi:hypothetical protein